MTVDSETIRRVNDYYGNSPDYLSGWTKGRCHFGYTEKGENFDPGRDLMRMEREIIKALHLPYGSTVADFGCGFGRVADSLARQAGLEIYGIDLSQERTQEARRFIDEKVFFANQIKIIRGSYCHLPLRNESLDGGCTVETLCHAPNLQKTLTEFMRTLKPGGRLALFEYSIPTEDSLDPIRKLITRKMIERTGMTSVKYFTKNAFPEILSAAGFVNVKVNDISEKVWPNWKWMFWRAVSQIPQISKKRAFGQKTNFAAELMIWPYHKFLGYNIVTANKPVRGLL